MWIVAQVEWYHLTALWEKSPVDTSSGYGQNGNSLMTRSNHLETL